MDAHGSRLLYMVGRYEEMAKATEEEHAAEALARKEKAAAAKNKTDSKDKAKEDARAAEEAEWRNARKGLEAEKREVEKQLTAALREKGELEEEILKMKETLEAMALAKVQKVDLKEVEELRGKLREKQAEVDETHKKMEAAMAQLEAVKQASASREREVQQTQMQAEAGGAALATAEARLRSVIQRLGSSESAQRRQEGFYFSAASGPILLPGNIIGSPQSSREASPTRSPGRRDSRELTGRESPPRSPPLSPVGVVHPWQACRTSMLRPGDSTPGRSTPGRTSSPGRITQAWSPPSAGSLDAVSLEKASRRAGRLTLSPPEALLTPAPAPSRGRRAVSKERKAQRSDRSSGSTTRK